MERTEIKIRSTGVTPYNGPERRLDLRQSTEASMIVGSPNLFDFGPEARTAGIEMYRRSANLSERFETPKPMDPRLQEIQLRLITAAGNSI